MNALVEHFAATGDLRAAAPLLFHAEAAAVAVASADEHHRAKNPGIEDLAGLEERRVKSVIEADLDDDTGLPGGCENRFQLGGISRCGFFDQHVLSRFYRGQ